MELCRHFNQSNAQRFSLIDTPGPDEAMQGELLYKKVEEVLMESDAVICVRPLASESVLVFGITTEPVLLLYHSTPTGAQR
jgi:hypothetical protein